MKSRLLGLSLATVFTIGALYACGGKKPPKEPAITETVADAGVEDAAPPPPEKPKSLYERLGGKDAIAKVVDGFITKLNADPKTKGKIGKVKGAKLDHFKAMLVDQLCEATGGTEKYTGKDMKTAHKGMKITEDEWNATVADLKAALDEAKVPEKESGELFSLLAPMKDDIVEVKPKPTTPPKK